MRVEIFYHVALYGPCSESIIEEQVVCLNEAKIHCDSLYVNIANDDMSRTQKTIKYLNRNLKYNLEIDTSKLVDFEYPTLRKLYERADENDNVLYIHTKGVSKCSLQKYTNEEKLKYQLALGNKPGNKTENINAWRNKMMEFCVTKWKTCLSKMENENYKLCGHNWHHGNCKIKNHISGNMWWAKADYIKTCDTSYLKSNSRYDAEMFIGSGNAEKIFYEIKG
jgi:hypothetical protein